MRLGPRGGARLARAIDGLSRTLWAVEKVAAGFLEEAGPRLLDDRGARAFTEAIWEATGVHDATGLLFAWELRWFEQDLPPAPARLLVGAAGRGREVRWLVDHGYDVVAFEPVAAFVRSLHEAGARVVAQLSYEDICAARDCVVHREAPYDAVLLGWGSLSLVQEASARLETIRTSRALCPEGPILASCLRPAVTSGRARKLGRAAARLLGLGTGGLDAFYPHMGFVHLIDDSEMESLVGGTGHRLARPLAEVFEYPHFTLLPAQPGVPPITPPTATSR